VRHCEPEVRFESIIAWGSLRVRHCRCRLVDYLSQFNVRRRTGSRQFARFPSTIAGVARIWPSSLFRARTFNSSPASSTTTTPSWDARCSTRGEPCFLEGDQCVLRRLNSTVMLIVRTSRIGNIMPVVIFRLMSAGFGTRPPRVLLDARLLWARVTQWRGRLATPGVQQEPH
jgi:hypothetical protein